MKEPSTIARKMWSKYGALVCAEVYRMERDQAVSTEIRIETGVAVSDIEAAARAGREFIRTDFRRL